MNNKKIFSVKLFWQSFLQLKVIGIVSTVVMVFLSAFPVIMEAINIRQAIEREGAQSASSYVTIVNPVGSAGVLMIVFLILTPVLALYAWNFLNKRSTSDFYHSLPYRRENLYLTRLAAVVSWQLIIFAVTFLATAVSYIVFSDYFVVNFGTMFKVYVSEFLSSLLCAAAVSFACSLTGNIFGNICLTGLILFFPRFILLLIQQFLSGMVYLASSSHLLPFLDNNYNLVVGQVFSVFTNSSTSEILLSNAGMIYTLVLSLIYIALGCFMFVKRKSEAAGKPALNSKLQFVIRCMIGFTISVFGVVEYVVIKRDGRNDETGVFAVFIAFLIAAVVVVVYELISNKKLHRVIKSIPSIIVSYGLAILFGFIISAAADRMIAYSPSTDDIQYIKLSSPYRGYGSSNDYFSGVIENIKIDDKDIIGLVTESLKDNIKIIDENERYWSVLNSSNYSVYEVYIKDGVFGRYRNVYISSDDVLKLAEMLTKYEDFCDEYRNLPDFDEAAIGWSEDVSDENSRKIYDTMLKEISEISFADWYNNVNSDYAITAMDIQFSREGKVYNSYIPITEKLKKTSEMYMNAVNEETLSDNKESFDDMKEFFSSLPLNSKYNNNYENYLNVTDVKSGKDLTIWFKDIKDEDFISQLVKELDGAGSATEFDFDKPIVMINYVDYSTDSYEYMSFYVQPDGYNSIEDYKKIADGSYTQDTIIYD